jgi:hypothetical protein
MSTATLWKEMLDQSQAPVSPLLVSTRQRRSWWSRIRSAFLGISLAIEWVFGLASMVMALSILAALPLAQFLSLGYLLESSGRVARTGRLRDGLIGIRRAARIGGAVAGIWLSLVPAWLVGSFARSADLIDPDGAVSNAWRAALLALTVLSILNIALACARGGRFRYFVLPLGHPFWLAHRLCEGGLYTEARDGFWAFLIALRVPYYFRLGLFGFLGALVWIVLPATLIALGGRAPLLGVLGALLLAVIAPSLLFLQVHFAVEGRVSALFALRDVRDRFRRAPWAFAFALLVLIVAAIPLYLLKIEMVPREAAWLPALVFVAFLAPARLLSGWAYARSSRREHARHWLFRWMGRLAIIPAAALYVLVVFAAQYTSWGGTWSLFEQHAFLLPVPFLSL